MGILKTSLSPSDNGSAVEACSAEFLTAGDAGFVISVNDVVNSYQQALYSVLVKMKKGSIIFPPRGKPFRVKQQHEWIYRVQRLKKGAAVEVVVD